MPRTRANEYLHSPEITLTTTAWVSLLTGIVGLRLLAVEMVASNMGATDVEVIFRDGIAGKIYTISCPQPGSFSFHPIGGWLLTTGNDLQAKISIAGTVKVSVEYGVERP